MVAYILDSLESREGALGALWISLGVTNLACMASLVLSFLQTNESIVMSLALAFSIGLTLFLTGRVHPLTHRHTASDSRVKDDAAHNWGNLMSSSCREMHAGCYVPQHSHTL